MGAYKYIKETLQKEYKSADGRYKNKIRTWGKEGAIVKVEYPSNLDRARRVGYRAKQGYAIVRIRIGKGRRTRKKSMGGRKPRHNYKFVQPGQSHQQIAEQRVNREYKNMEVLNSYWVGEDGVSKYFEVVLADPSRKTVTTRTVARKGKSFRGLTSAGKRSRGHRKKRVRPTHSRA
jgi:large subunit ribosomal protein L15e